VAKGVITTVAKRTSIRQRDRSFDVLVISKQAGKNATTTTLTTTTATTSPSVSNSSSRNASTTAMRSNSHRHSSSSSAASMTTATSRVEIRLLGVAGITVERLQCSDVRKRSSPSHNANTAHSVKSSSVAPPPPEMMRAVAIAVKGSHTYGLSQPSDPLKLSGGGGATGIAARVGGKQRCVAVWNREGGWSGGGNNSSPAVAGNTPPLTFVTELPLVGTRRQEKFELRVILTDGKITLPVGVAHVSIDITDQKPTLEDLALQPIAGNGDSDGPVDTRVYGIDPSNSAIRVEVSATHVKVSDAATVASADARRAQMSTSKLSVLRPAVPNLRMKPDSSSEEKKDDGDNSKNYVKRNIMSRNVGGPPRSTTVRNQVRHVSSNSINSDATAIRRNNLRKPSSKEIAPEKRREPTQTPPTTPKKALKTTSRSIPKASDSDKKLSSETSQANSSSRHASPSGAVPPITVETMTKSGTPSLPSIRASIQNKSSSAPSPISRNKVDAEKSKNVDDAKEEAAENEKNGPSSPKKKIETESSSKLTTSNKANSESEAQQRRSREERNSSVEEIKREAIAEAEVEPIVPALEMVHKGSSASAVSTFELDKTVIMVEEEPKSSVSPTLPRVVNQNSDISTIFTSDDEDDTQYSFPTVHTARGGWGATDKFMDYIPWTQVDRLFDKLPVDKFSMFQFSTGVANDNDTLTDNDESTFLGGSTVRDGATASARYPYPSSGSKASRAKNSTFYSNVVCWNPRLSCTDGKSERSSTKVGQEENDGSSAYVELFQIAKFDLDDDSSLAAESVSSKGMPAIEEELENVGASFRTASFNSANAKQNEAIQHLASSDVLADDVEVTKMDQISLSSGKAEENASTRSTLSLDDKAERRIRDRSNNIAYPGVHVEIDDDAVKDNTYRPPKKYPKKNPQNRVGLSAVVHHIVDLDEDPFAGDEGIEIDDRDFAAATKPPREKSFALQEQDRKITKKDVKSPQTKLPPVSNKRCGPADVCPTGQAAVTTEEIEVKIDDKNRNSTSVSVASSAQVDHSCAIILPLDKQLESPEEEVWLFSDMFKCGEKTAQTAPNKESTYSRPVLGDGARSKIAVKDRPDKEQYVDRGLDCVGVSTLLFSPPISISNRGDSAPAKPLDIEDGGISIDEMRASLMALNRRVYVDPDMMAAAEAAWAKRYAEHERRTVANNTNPTTEAGASQQPSTPSSQPTTPLSPGAAAPQSTLGRRRGGYESRA